MRLGVLSDVHGNRQALDAVMAWLDAQGVDRLVCAGDLVGYGPDPVGCAERVLARCAPVVCGNHELLLAGELDLDRCTPSARASLAWTATVVPSALREQLAALPRTASVVDGEVTVTHGAPGDVQRYVRTGPDAADALAGFTERVLVVGHTHEPLLADARGAVGSRGGARAGTGETVALPTDGTPVLLNPGAVGQTRGGPPRARCAVLDLAAGTVTFAALRYDLRGARRALRAAGQPTDLVHVREGWRPRAGRLARRAGLRP